MTMSPCPGVIDCSIKSQCQAWETSLSVLGKGGIQETIQAIDVALGCLPELKGKSPPIAIGNTVHLYTGLGGEELELPRNHLPEY